MSKDIINKLDQIEDLTDSQKDRLNVKEQATTNLLAFLNNFITTIATKNDLNDKIDLLILEKIQKEIEIEGVEGVSWGVLLKLKELVNKQHVESATPILKIIENAVKQPESPLNPSKNFDNESTDESAKITQNDYKAAKKILKFIEGLSNTEFNEKEKI